MLSYFKRNLNKFLYRKELATIHEQEITKRARFYSQFINPGDLVFDVGANVGNRIEPLLQIGARVVAVEPQEKCYRVLKKKFGNRIQLVTKGLDEKAGTKDFYISNADTISSFSSEWIKSVKDNRFKGYRWNKIVSVEMTTLDELIAEFGVPRFIKIDVEGFELNVLKGLTRKVEFLSFEYTVPEQSGQVTECLGQIQKIADFECNYSVGEGMEWALPQWISAEEMKAVINSEAFTSTLFGDVYVKMIN